MRPVEVDINNVGFFNNILDEFEMIWDRCFKDKSISKSAAFTAYVNINQTANLIRYLESVAEVDNDEGDEWQKTTQ